MIQGKWNDEYVQDLGILDHCHEIIVLKNKIRELKAYKDEKNVTKYQNLLSTYEHELVDLYLILEKFVEDRQDLIADRISRFNEKEEESEEQIYKPFNRKWCMCTEINLVAKDFDATCCKCGGKDAYGIFPDRPEEFKKTLKDKKGC